MRSYPANSPQAAARIVALAMLSDGHLSKAELDVLERLGVHDQIGLDRDALHAVMHAFCEDLLSTAHLTWADSCRVDPRTLAALMAEIDDPALQLKLLRICAAVVEVDAHVADGEAIVLGAAVEHWGLQRAMLDGRVAAAAR
ncbi:MAG: TerB family tellurite resistance protein [Rhizobacter sp.]|nr:TerB family tellurite resistance protein [Rhizobacter sp.]